MEDHRPTLQGLSRYSPAVKLYWPQWNSLVIENSDLKRMLENADGTAKRRQTVVPKKWVAEILGEIHCETSGGHLGLAKSLIKV